jgi:homoserine kinase
VRGGVPPLAVRLEKNLPLSSGLGSSSSSIVAALVAFNELFDRPLGLDTLLALAGEAESGVSGAAHLDNVAPALLGGLVLLPAHDTGRPPARLPWPKDLVFVVAHPDFELSTAKARAVLPPTVPLSVAVDHAGNLGCLVHALHARDRELLCTSLRDLLVEPYRVELIPAFEAVKRGALDAGALGASISGAGPSVFAVASMMDAQRVSEAMEAAFHGAGLASDLHVCEVDPNGARVL